MLTKKKNKLTNEDTDSRDTVTIMCYTIPYIYTYI